MGSNLLSEVLSLVLEIPLQGQVFGPFDVALGNQLINTGLFGLLGVPYFGQFVVFSRDNVLHFLQLFHDGSG